MSLKSARYLKLKQQKSSLVPLVRKRLQSFTGSGGDERIYRCLESLNLVVLTEIYEGLGREK